MNLSTIASYLVWDRHKELDEEDQPPLTERHFQPDLDGFERRFYSDWKELDGVGPHTYWHHIKSGKDVCEEFQVAAILPDGLLVMAERLDPNDQTKHLIHTIVVAFPSAEDEPHTKAMKAIHNPEGDKFPDWLEEIGFEVWDWDLTTDLLSSIAKMARKKLAEVENLNSDAQVAN